MTGLVANLYRGFGPVTGGSTAPNTPTLTITDKGDGTGATATIAGSTAGSTNTVYAVPALNPTGLVVPVASASRTGDGTVQLSLTSGRYIAYVESVFNGLYAAPQIQDYSFSATAPGASIAGYAGIVAAVRNLLTSDAVLTDATVGLLASYALIVNGVAQSPSRANSIFGAEPPGDRNFPCLSLWELKIGPALPKQNDTPMAGVFLPLQISAWGKRQDLRAIITEVDNVLEGAWYGGAMDTSDWKFADIDTSGDWTSIRVPDSYAMDSGQPIVQFAKVLGVNASNKTLFPA